MKKNLSKVEIKGMEAYLYDELMIIISAFTYNKFIEQAIKDINIQPHDKIIDFGSGTAKNICLMKKYTNGLIVGLDIGKEMLKKSKKRCKSHNNVKIFYHDIRKKTPFVEEFDTAFISFAMHGFIDSDRDKIIQNAYDSLKPGGKFCILDYNEFDLEKQNIMVQAIFKYGECPLASDFIKIDFKEKLKKFGFENFKEYYYYSNFVRLLVGTK